MFENEAEISFLLSKLEALSVEKFDEFEDLRGKLIGLYIDSFPERHKTRALWFQSNLERDLNKYKHPTARFNRMVEVFWEKFFDFQDSLNNPEKFYEDSRNNKSEVITLRKSGVGPPPAD